MRPSACGKSPRTEASSIAMAAAEPVMDHARHQQHERVVGGERQQRRHVGAGIAIPAERDVAPCPPQQSVRIAGRLGSSLQPRHDLIFTRAIASLQQTGHFDHPIHLCLGRPRCCFTVTMRIPDGPETHPHKLMARAISVYSVLVAGGSSLYALARVGGRPTQIPPSPPTRSVA